MGPPRSQGPDWAGLRGGGRVDASEGRHGQPASSVAAYSSGQGNSRLSERAASPVSAREATPPGAATGGAQVSAGQWRAAPGPQINTATTCRPAPPPTCVAVGNRPLRLHLPEGGRAGGRGAAPPTPPRALLRDASGLRHGTPGPPAVVKRPLLRAGAPSVTAQGGRAGETNSSGPLRRAVYMYVPHEESADGAGRRHKWPLVLAK
ncbi:translation initiation factor IF-2-like [Schistocerca cancellata]|uniref:translation initiation factor IF-2-like n=1 Tax=Schistocerca cancellata TaxID=274614 RepID=UPI0021196F7D|nr:translation initiation factor IF-2-like [Schistocerca cancellata]